MSRKLALVDDEKDIREILRHAIELTRKWTVVEASDGAQGLDLIRRELPDAILLDVMMPRMDGREVFRSILKDPLISSIPVIFLTASLQKHDIRALQELGPVAILEKPFDPIGIVSEISRLLGWDSD